MPVVLKIFHQNLRNYVLFSEESIGGTLSVGAIPFKVGSEKLLADELYFHNHTL